MFNNPILNNIALGTQDAPNIGGEKNIRGKDSPFSQTLEKIISPQKDDNSRFHKLDRLKSDFNEKNIMHDNGVNLSQQSPSPLKKFLEFLKTNNSQGKMEDIEKEIEGFINNRIVEKLNLLLEEKGIEGIEAIEIQDFINEEISGELEFIFSKERIDTGGFLNSEIVEELNLLLEGKGIEGIEGIEIQDFINGEIFEKLGTILTENGAKIENLTSEGGGIREEPGLFTAGEKTFLAENFPLNEEVKENRWEQGKELTERFKTAEIGKEGGQEQLNANKEGLLLEEGEELSLKDAFIDKETLSESKIGMVSDQKEIRTFSKDAEDIKNTKDSLTKEMLDKKLNNLDIDKKVSGDENKNFNQSDEGLAFDQKAIVGVEEMVLKRVSSEAGDTQQKTRDVSLAFESEAESKKISSLEMKNKDMDMGMNDNDGFMRDIKEAQDVHSNSKSAQSQKLDSMVLDQIIDKMKKPLFNLGKSEMKLTLKPEFLGEVKMDISVEKNVFRADITVDNSMVKEILDGNLDKLKQSLESQGLQMEKFSVSVGHEKGSQQAKYQHSETKRAFNSDQGTIQGTEEDLPSKSVMENGRLDLLI